LLVEGISSELGFEFTPNWNCIFFQAVLDKLSSRITDKGSEQSSIHDIGQLAEEFVGEGKTHLITMDELGNTVEKLNEDRDLLLGF
jgi:hypothetical protein